MPKLLLPILMAVMLAGCNFAEMQAQVEAERQEEIERKKRLDDALERVRSVGEDYRNRPKLTKEEILRKKQGICYGLYNSTGSNFDYFNRLADSWLTVNEMMACASGEL